MDDEHGFDDVTACAVMDEDGQPFPWTLGHLMLPHDEVQGFDPPSEANTRALVEALHEEWADPNIEMHDMYRWTLERYGLREDQEFGIQVLEHKMVLRKYQYKQLINFIETLGLFEYDGDIIDKMTDIQRIMSAAYTTCFDMFVLFNRLDGTRGNKIPPKVTDDESFEDHDANKLTSFQRLLIYILRRIFVKKWKKCGDSCFEQIVTDEGFQTIAYRHVSTIEEEVWNVQKEVSFPMWKLFTNPRDNPRVVTEHLKRSREAEFPELNVGDGHWYAFANGTYNIRHDLFFEYGTVDDYKTYAQQMQQARARQEPYPIPTDNDVAINYFPIDFTDPPTPENPDIDPLTISTPTFERVLDTQHLEEDTKKWVYIFTGRMFFLANELERWQRCFFILGAGGSGKSTIAQWLRYVIPKQHCAYINSNFEQQFGLGPLCKDEYRYCMCTEMGEDIRLKQEEFQLCVEGGELQVAIKGHDSFPYDWRKHMLMLGNQFPKIWKNNGKQISRRSFLIQFSYLIDKAKIDTMLKEKLEAETPRLLRKCSRLYVDMATRHPTADIEAPGLMPEQVRGFIRRFEAAIDPLASFLESPEFIYEGHYYMPLDDFRKEYFEFRKNNGFGVVPWVLDHYETAIQSRKCFVQEGTREYNGTTINNTKWLIGIMPAAMKVMQQQEDYEME